MSAIWHLCCSPPVRPHQTEQLTWHKQPCIEALWNSATSRRISACPAIQNGTWRVPTRASAGRGRRCPAKLATFVADRSAKVLPSWVHISSLQQAMKQANRKVVRNMISDNSKLLLIYGWYKWDFQFKIHATDHWSFHECLTLQNNSFLSELHLVAGMQ